MCRAMDVERICLLDISPPDARMAQRRVLEVEVGGGASWALHGGIKAPLWALENMVVERRDGPSARGCSPT